MKVILIFLGVIILSCNNKPKANEIQDAIGVYNLTKYTNENIYSKLKDYNIELFVYEDQTFEIKADKDYCFTHIKGKWTIEHDLERSYYVLELNNRKTSEAWMTVKIDCDSIQGVLVFDGIKNRKPFK